MITWVPPLVIPELKARNKTCAQLDVSQKLPPKLAEVLNTFQKNIQMAYKHIKILIITYSHRNADQAENKVVFFFHICVRMP